MKIGYLGIDVSKGYADFALLSDKKEMLEGVFQLDDTQQGHAKLLYLLGQFAKKHKLDGINAAVESTGGYENNWLSFLKNEGHWVKIKTARINPFGVKHDGIASMERTTTDATSARRIAIYIMNHPEKANWEESAYDLMDSLRSMYNYIRTKVKQKVQLQNQLEKLLYTAFPEMLNYIQEQLPKWLLYTLQIYPTAASMRDAEISDLIKIKGVTEVKAKELIKKAEQSISWSDNATLRQIIASYASDILNLIVQVEELKKSLETQKEITHEMQILESFRGIGRYSAIGLMIEIENISRFKNVKKLCSFFGVHPKFKQSGDKISGIRMSKAGSPEVRAVLYMVAKSALIYNPHIRKIYDRFREQGMVYNQAMGVIMHKILRIIYGMLKSKAFYDPSYDMQKQEITAKYLVNKNTKTKVETEAKNKKRYQELSIEAPISKRQVRKRKEQLTSPGS
jgi:transposase